MQESEIRLRQELARLYGSGSGEGLMPDDTKPLPEPMITNHKYTRSCGIQMRAISQEILKIFILNMSLKITTVKSLI